VLRSILGPQREEVTGDCRKLHGEELHDSHSSTNVTGVSKIRRNEMVGGGCGMYGGEGRCTRVLVGNLRERRHLEDLCVGGSITVELILNNIGCKGHVSGCCEQGNEPSVSTKLWEFLY
jgi:hypothetical protein